MRYFRTILAGGMLAIPFAALAGPVNVNKADAETIAAELNGIGIAKAKAIVEYRRKHGPFRSVEDLSLVKGIGDRMVEKNKSDIKLSDGSK